MLTLAAKYASFLTADAPAVPILLRYGENILAFVQKVDLEPLVRSEVRLREIKKIHAT